MTILKSKDRALKAANVRKAFREMGAAVKDLGTYSKWQEVQMGRLQVSMTVYEFNLNNEKSYVLADSLDRIACVLTKNKKEVFEWLKNHGYKTEKRFYIEDTGMSEETWNIWNGNGEEEE